MEKLRCTIERVVYSNEDTGYSILTAKSVGYPRPITIVGTLFGKPPGCVLVCKGEWKDVPKYGRQFQVELWDEEMPTTVRGIEAYLCSDAIQGVGPRTAKQIVAKFGMKTIDVLNKTPNRLFEIPFLGKKRIEKFIESWAKQKDVRDIMIFLQNVGISSAYATKVFKQYGQESVRILNENPYRLADDIAGIGFVTADGIAHKMGFSDSDISRCCSGILYTLNKMAENKGHVYADRRLLMDEAAKLLHVDDVLEKALDMLIEEHSVKVEGNAIYLPKYYQAETGVAKHLARVAQAPIPRGKHCDANMAKIARMTQVVYDENQISAIKTAASSKIMVLTGGPGTGKTTTTQGIIMAFKNAGLSILLAAPTGRAAKRLSEATGMAAKTIHRLLEYNPTESFNRNEDNSLEGDMLIVDECSMIDLNLMYHLIKAVPSAMRLILIGDVNQLPSVGAGCVLRDIIQSQKVPVVQLHQIFRQAQSSDIVMNAHAINQGKSINWNKRSNDFFFLECLNETTATNEIINLIKNRLPNAYHIKQSDIQVLTPMATRGETGAANLNAKLQEALNPSSKGMVYRHTMFCIGDRVMQIKNNYHKDVYNGDLGIVEQVDLEDKCLTVRFDGKLIEYEKNELEELMLAYAITIHKSQGSEYPIVIIPVFKSQYAMLKRNLIYTAITRAKKICILIGQKDALSLAIRTAGDNNRNTKLIERLQRL